MGGPQREARIIFASTLCYCNCSQSVKGLRPKVLWFSKQQSIKHGDRAYLSPLSVSSGAWQCPSPCGQQSSGPMNAVLRDVFKNPANSLDLLPCVFLYFWSIKYSPQFHVGLCGTAVERAAQLILCGWGTPACASMVLCKCLWWFSLLLPILSLVSILERVPLDLPSKKPLVYCVYLNTSINHKIHRSHKPTLSYV